MDNLMSYSGGESEIWAHTPSPNSGREGQSLRDHAIETADMAAKFAKLFGAADWIYAASLLHDLGKADLRFQKYLRENALADSDEDGEDNEND